MEFLAWRMPVIILQKQYAFGRLNIKIFSLFCSLYWRKWENSFCVCMCDGATKKNWAILRNCGWQSTFVQFSKYFTHFGCANRLQTSSLSLRPSRNFSRLLKLVKILHVINGNTLIYYKLKRKFRNAQLWYIIQCHPHEARKFFHWLHPCLEIFYSIQLSHRQFNSA
jgi:hypothetical protein